MKPENIWAYGLLEDVKRDAVRKADGKKPTVQVYAAIQQILQLDRWARKEGLLLLDQALDDAAEDTGLSILSVGIDYITGGKDFDLTAEMLAAQYWTKKPQGMEALANYICIRGLVEILNGEHSPYNLELLLKSFLTEECKAGYESYKAERYPEPVPDTPKEKLEKTYVKFGAMGSLLRNTLEEKLAHVPEQTIKEAIQEMRDDESPLFLAVKGLSTAGREKLFSCMSETRVDSICEDIEYMGPVRAADIEDAFVWLIESIEAVSGKTMDK